MAEEGEVVVEERGKGEREEGGGGGGGAEEVEAGGAAVGEAVRVGGGEPKLPTEEHSNPLTRHRSSCVSECVCVCACVCVCVCALSLVSRRRKKEGRTNGLDSLSLCFS